jgi:hypothetical protein
MRQYGAQSGPQNSICGAIWNFQIQQAAVDTTHLYCFQLSRIQCYVIFQKLDSCAWHSSWVSRVIRLAAPIPDNIKRKRRLVQKHEVCAAVSAVVTDVE